MTHKIISTKTMYPYTRLKGMKELMTFIQEPGWKPDSIDAHLLKKLVIAKGRENEAANALYFLGLIDEKGSPTTTFDKLKTDYVSTLNQIIREKYAEIFNLIPPRMMNQQRLVNLFDTTTETAEYQAKLFVWFCKESDIDLPNVEKRFHRSRFDKKKEKTIA